MDDYHLRYLGIWTMFDLAGPGWPRGLVNWTLIIVVGVLLSRLLGDVIHNAKQLEEIGFILLPLPVLISWALELFEQEQEEEEELESNERDGARVRHVEDCDGYLDGWALLWFLCNRERPFRIPYRRRGG